MKTQTEVERIRRAQIQKRRSDLNYPPIDPDTLDVVVDRIRSELEDQK